MLLIKIKITFLPPQNIWTLIDLKYVKWFKSWSFKCLHTKKPNLAKKSHRKYHWPLPKNFDQCNLCFTKKNCELHKNTFSNSRSEQLLQKNTHFQYCSTGDSVKFSERPCFKKAADWLNVMLPSGLKHLLLAQVPSEKKRQNSYK